MRHVSGMAVASGRAVNKAAKAVIACMDIHKLVDIKEQNPIGGGFQRMLVGRLQAPTIAALRDAGHHCAHGSATPSPANRSSIASVPSVQSLENTRKSVKPTGAVMRQPFQQRTRLRCGQSGSRGNASGLPFFQRGQQRRIIRARFQLRQSWRDASDGALVQAVQHGILQQIAPASRPPRDHSGEWRRRAASAISKRSQ